MARQTCSVGQDVLEGDLLRDMLVGEDEVVADQVADWCCPLDVWVFIVVGDEGGHYGGGEGFGGAACVE